MRKRFPWFSLLPVGMLMMALGFVMLSTPDPAAAQCGASASSCKNCHEVNAKYPVNGSGQWHIKHAFGDFCAFCHGGNVQAIEPDMAHKGMVYPLADPKASCQTCHPTDTMERAQVYAVVLGVDLQAGGSTGSGGGSGSGGQTDPQAVESKPIPPPGERRASGALIDYNRRYAVEVLGQFDTSQTGNAILAVAAVGLLALGTFLFWRFERIGQLLRKAAAVPEASDWRQHIPKYQVRGPVIPGRKPDGEQKS